MKAVILCGGLGTRLREETDVRPKPMVTIGGRPILWHLMKILEHGGVRDFVLCLGYKGEVIREYFLNFDAMTRDFTTHPGQGRTPEFHDGGVAELSVSLVDTGNASMTGARVRRVRHLLGDEPFMVCYGDSLAGLDVRELLAFHGAHEKLVTVTAVHPVSRFGELAMSEHGLVTGFREKPRMETWANAGFFVMEPGAIAYLEGGGDGLVLESEPLQRLAADGQLAAYRYDGDFYAMDTQRDHLELNALWDAGRAGWKVWS